MGYMLETRGLTKRFGRGGQAQDAVADVSLHIREGEVYGLLGPNGAGKSTTLKMICGMLRPTAGEILFAGHAWRREDLYAIGSLIEEAPLYPNLTARENLGRNAAIGAGAAGMLLAFFSVGGLAHGLMTGELTGALATPLSWVPLAWPARLGSLGVEAFIDAARAAGPLLTTALASLVLTLAADAVLLAWFCRFEDGRADA